jgi:hypothetical protein
MIKYYHRGFNAVTQSLDFEVFGYINAYHIQNPKIGLPCRLNFDFVFL